MESPLHENIMLNEESREGSSAQILEESLEFVENGYGTEREGEARTKDDQSRLESEVLAEDGVRPIGVFSGRVTIN